MKTKIYIILTCALIFLSCISFKALNVYAAEQGSGKKVYALYHGFRRTREHDGDLGTWKQFYSSENSVTGQKTVNYNPDLIDSEGRAQMASVNGGPVVGMQSELDPDYIEYKILLAKMAHIDGFLVDFGFPEYGNTVLLSAFMEQAEKYDFEIGVNWCDSWLVDKTWIQSYRPEINTREKRLEHFKTSVQYLLDEVYSRKNAAIFNGHPLIFMFGGGPTASEMQNILNAGYNIPDGLGEPWYVRRITPQGQYSNGSVSYYAPDSAAQPWLNIGVDVHSWIALRLRPSDSLHSEFDKYALPDDVIAYNQKFSSLWKNGKKAHLNTAVVTPGFDNHGCAGWGAGTFTGIDRDGGSLYERQWQFDLQNKKLLDVVFIASWSDFTEGHEIEPTAANGYRELETTQKYAAQMKDIVQSGGESEYLRLPQRLFEARKKYERFEELDTGLAVCGEWLEDTAKNISVGNYDIAEETLSRAERLLSFLDGTVNTETISVSAEIGNLTVKGSSDNNGNYSLNSGISLTLDEVTAKYIRENVYDAVLEFTYDDDSYETILINAGSLRGKPPLIGNTRGDYSVAANIKKDSSGNVVNARVPLCQKNIALTRCGKNGSDFWFSGSGTVRGIRLIFNVASLKPEYADKVFWVVSAGEDENAVTAELISAASAPSEFVLCACLFQRGAAVSARIFDNTELRGGTNLRFEKTYKNEPAVLRLFAWDSLEGMHPLDSVFEFSD